MLVDPPSRLAALRRVSLGHWPTPFEPMAGVTRALAGPEIYVKRDDCSGLALGGSKLRKLEYSLGAALDAGADTVFVSGSIQSNQARLAAFAAARLGLRCRALLEDRLDRMPDEYRRSGNVLLDRLAGAEVTVFPKGTRLDAELDLAVSAHASRGGVSHVLRGGAPEPDGVVGYVSLAIELIEQTTQRGLALDHVVLATESAGLQAGLLVGLHMLGSRARVWGVSVNRPASVQAEAVHALAERTCAYLRLSPSLPRERVDVDDRFAGAGYGRQSASATEAQRLAARCDGLLLDPVYTGKACAGLIAGVREARWRHDETVVFLHSGGAPVVFAYAEHLAGGAPS